MTVSDDLAVGRRAEGRRQSVDVFVTVVVNVPADLAAQGRYYADRSTKITYQDMVILAREGAFYVVRASLPVAEEIAHLQATGNATFSLALRPKRTAAGRCHGPRRDHEPDHPALRPADPGALSGGRRPIPASRRSRPPRRSRRQPDGPVRPGPVGQPGALSEPASPDRAAGAAPIDRFVVRMHRAGPETCCPEPVPIDQPPPLTRQVGRA